MLINELLNLFSPGKTSNLVLNEFGEELGTHLQDVRNKNQGTLRRKGMAQSMNMTLTL